MIYLLSKMPVCLHDGVPPHFHFVSVDTILIRTLNGNTVSGVYSGFDWQFWNSWTFGEKEKAYCDTQIQEFDFFNDSFLEYDENETIGFFLLPVEKNWKSLNVSIHSHSIPNRKRNRYNSGYICRYNWKVQYFTSLILVLNSTFVNNQLE